MLISCKYHQEMKMDKLVYEDLMTELEELYLMLFEKFQEKMH